MLVVSGGIIGVVTCLGVAGLTYSILRFAVFIKGKVAEVSEESGTQNVTVVAENAVTGEKIHQEVEMVVLATGMQPTVATDKLTDPGRT